MTNFIRLLVDRDRLKQLEHNNGIVYLNENESHYLNRVLRFNRNDKLDIIDGQGKLWHAYFESTNVVKILSEKYHPSKSEPRPSPLICIAISIPKIGFDIAVRMCCELGIDAIQPIYSDRRTPQARDRINRWNKILTESVEQSERLWKPSLYAPISFSDWIDNLSPSSALGIAVTRKEDSIRLTSWLDSINKNINQIWIAIGPEGGWTPREESLAITSGASIVSLSKSILRTSTAFVSATQSISLYRDSKF